MFCLLCDDIKLVVTDDTQHRLRIGYLFATTALDCTYYYITGQQKPYLWLLLKRTVRQNWVASSQNEVRLHLGTELLT